MDNAYTAVVPGDVVAVAAAAAADEVVVDGVVEGDAEPVTDGVEEVVVAHRNEVRVESSDYIQEQAGDSGFLTGSGLTVKLSRPDPGDSGQDPAGGAEGQVHCTHFVEDKSVEKASEEEGKYSGVHMNCMPVH